MEKTPSVTTIRNRASCAARSCSSSSTMSRLRYRSRRALDSRMPSMIEAWFSASEMMASSAPKSVSKTPPLASKQEANRMASWVPRKPASRRSSSRCCSWVPQMKRTLASP